MQHFATLFYATFLKKYVIKNCKLEKVAKNFFHLVSLKKLKSIGGIGNGAAFNLCGGRYGLQR
jgi:hypothetical protein